MLGSEITINYDTNRFGDAHVKLQCKCSASNCKGIVYDESRQSSVLCVSNKKLVTKRFISGPSKNGTDYPVMKLDDDNGQNAADIVDSSSSAEVNGEKDDS